MFFYFTHILSLLFQPSMILLWLILGVIISIQRRRVRWARRFAIAALVWLTVIGILPTYVLILRPLENANPRPPLPKHVDGIVVLGAGLGVNVLLSRGVDGSGSSEPRIVGAFALARRYPDARIIFSGGPGDLTGGRSEAVAAKHLFNELGLDPRRLTIEARSRNTWENIEYSKQIARPRPGQVWVLATSAEQMARAMAIARRLHWQMVPWPTDYITTRKGFGDFFDITDNMRQTDVTVHELAGYLVYRLSGRAD